MIFKYVLTSRDLKAMPIHSEKNWLEMDKYIKKNSKKTESGDSIFSWGSIDFINPEIKLPGEFVECMPAIL